MARRALGPATLAAVQAVEAALLETDRYLLVACSGGVDSLALARAVVPVGRRRDLAIGAVVVDHGLQAGSGEQAQAAAATLRRIGYADVEVITVVVVPDRGGLEAAARTARYDALRAAAERRAATVLLAHTQDDQAETVLLGLARGSGMRSLAGMGVRSGPGGWLLRPLLGLPRSITSAICRENDLSPWQDPHNADPAFARVRVRRRVLPMLETELGPGIAAALARTAVLTRDDADLLDALAAEVETDTATLSCATIESQPPAIRRRIVASWLRQVHRLSDLAAVHLLAVDALVVNWRGQAGVDLPGGIRVRRVAGQLEVAPAAEFLPTEMGSE